MVEGPKSMAASIKARLLTMARKQNRAFDLLLVRFALERLLYRLSISTHHDDYVLKGGMLGLTPRPNSSGDKERLGGKERLGSITKQGDGYLRRLLVVVATAVMLMARKDASGQPWMAQILERMPTKIATEALAHKTARNAWAVMARKEVYTPAAV